jgi:hypothetical protein
VDEDEAHDRLKRGDLLLRTERFKAAISEYEAAGDHFVAADLKVKAVAVFKQIRGIVRRHRVRGVGELNLRILRKLARLYEQLGLSAEAREAHAAAAEAAKPV